MKRVALLLILCAGCTFALFGNSPRGAPTVATPAEAPPVRPTPEYSLLADPQAQAFIGAVVTGGLGLLGLHFRNRKAIRKRGG